MQGRSGGGAVGREFVESHFDKPESKPQTRIV
jgi:hypothetical protein